MLIITNNNININGLNNTYFLNHRTILQINTVKYRITLQLYYIIKSMELFCFLIKIICKGMKIGEYYYNIRWKNKGKIP